MVISLVGQLREVEQYNVKLEEARVKFNDSVMQYDIPGYCPTIILDHILPQFDVDRVQKYIIEERIEGYQGEGSILNEAVRGRQTVEDTLEELSQVNKGDRRFMPKFKDKQHNIRVEELHSLIDEDYETGDILTTKGVFSPGNSLTGGIYGLLIGGGGVYTTGELLRAIDLLKESAKDSSLLIPAILTALAMGGIVALACVLSNPSNEDLPWDNARYLDSRIKELLL